MPLVGSIQASSCCRCCSPDDDRRTDCSTACGAAGRGGCEGAHSAQIGKALAGAREIRGAGLLWAEQPWSGRSCQARRRRARGQVRPARRHSPPARLWRCHSSRLRTAAAGRSASCPCLHTRRKRRAHARRADGRGLLAGRRSAAACARESVTPSWCPKEQPRSSCASAPVLYWPNQLLRTCAWLMMTHATETSRRRSTARGPFARRPQHNPAARALSGRQSTPAPCCATDHAAPPPLLPTRGPALAPAGSSLDSLASRAACRRPNSSSISALSRAWSTEMGAQRDALRWAAFRLLQCEDESRRQATLS
jgi:hypothetical protein